MGRTLKSEWIKLRTTKALWYTSALVILFAMAFAILTGMGMGMSLSSEEVKKDPVLYASLMDSVAADQAFVGFSLFSLMVIIIQAVMFVTTEYSNNSSKTTLLGTPTRWQVPVAKFLVYGFIAALISLISMVISVLAMRWALSWNVDDQKILDLISLSADGVWKSLGLNVLYSVLVVMLSIGVGYLVRHTAGAIAIILLWKLVIEGLVIGQIPKIKEWLPPYMPFQNMDSGVMGMEVTDAPWGPTGSIIYFAVWAIVVFVAGVITLKKRDA